MKRLGLVDCPDLRTPLGVGPTSTDIGHLLDQLLPAPAGPTYPATHDGVAEALHNLGHSADRVARTLQRLGVRGEPDSGGGRCPIGVYLTRVLPEAHAVLVLTTEVTVYTDETGTYVRLHTTAAVEAFVEAFDDRRYPQLLDANPADDHTAETAPLERAR